MKFTTEELTEMRKLAGIDHSTVDYRRPQDFLPEARQTMNEEELPSNSEMPGKSIPTKIWTSKGSKTSLKALLVKHKEPKEISTGRTVPVEKMGEKDEVPPKS